MTDARKYKCEHCGEWCWLSAFCSGGSTFIMPWCLTCRQMDPRGAKLAYDRKRQREIQGVALREKNAKRASRAREIRQEQKAVRFVAFGLALDALHTIDLSNYTRAERRQIERDLQRIKEAIERERDSR